MVEGPEQVRVLVVSASPYLRYVISGEVGSDPDFFVVGTARTADDIVDKQSMLRPDLVLVDLESSHDLSDLKRTIAEVELPILALCSQTHDGADLAFGALEAGVADVVARPGGAMGGIEFVPELLRKVRGLARVRPRAATWHWNSLALRPKTSPRRFLPGDSLVVISASSGGVEPLVKLMSELPSDLNAPVLVLSPLPACYLHGFIRRIDAVTPFLLREARDGLPLKSGVAYLASYEHQLFVGTRGLLTLHRGSLDSDGYSSVDKTLSSLATRYGPAVLGVILSGLGQDAVQGALDVRAAGGSVIVQETSTCLVDETPRAVIDAGAASVVLPPERIPDEISSRAGQA